uniref:Cadherin cytoplasmic C-terminal domain-containing protein n=1 Tax=Trichuris muris TaxID=70415 RepID=A0A5S6R1V7_TRIMR
MPPRLTADILLFSWFAATSIFFCTGYPTGTLPGGMDESQRAQQVVDALMKSYVEETNDGYYPGSRGPPGPMPDTFEPAEVVFESSGDSDSPAPPYIHSPDNNDNQPLVDPLLGNVATESAEVNTADIDTIEATAKTDAPVVPEMNESATLSNKEDSDSLALRKLLPDDNERRPLGYLDPGSLTLTLVIVVAVMFIVSLVGLVLLTAWQYRRRRCSHRWTVSKAKSPAFQSDAWCYENVSDGGTMKKRDSVYLSGATLKPFAYAGSLATSNGTTRSSLFSESATRSFYDSEGHRWSDGEVHAGCSPYREKLVS